MAVLFGPSLKDQQLHVWGLEFETEFPSFLVFEDNTVTAGRFPEA